jgi:hypothetical protein
MRLRARDLRGGGYVDERSSDFLAHSQYAAVPAIRVSRPNAI